MEKAKVKFLQLTNGTVVDLDNLAFVLHAGINEYGILPKISAAGANAVPKLDKHELDEMIAGLEELGLAVKIKKLPRTEPEAKPEGKRIATA